MFLLVRCIASFVYILAGFYNCSRTAVLFYQLHKHDFRSFLVTRYSAVLEGLIGNQRLALIFVAVLEFVFFWCVALGWRVVRQIFFNSTLRFWVFQSNLKNKRSVVRFYTVTQRIRLNDLRQTVGKKVLQNVIFKILDLYTKCNYHCLQP